LKQKFSSLDSIIQSDLRQLNGRFFLAFHDGARNEQVVVTDRLGSMHGYYVLLQTKL